MSEKIFVTKSFASIMKHQFNFTEYNMFNAPQERNN